METIIWVFVYVMVRNLAVIFTSIIIIILNRKVLSFYMFLILIYIFNYFILTEKNVNISSFIIILLYINLGYLLLILVKKTKFYLKNKERYCGKYPLIKLVEISLINIKYTIRSIYKLQKTNSGWIKPNNVFNTKQTPQNCKVAILGLIPYIAESLTKIFYKSLKRFINIYNTNQNM